ncbi:DUF6907 domain-containing protein [Streptomyces turgidiscabies]|uniref:DUF6907 domain-containing protein n=1 Tax=Streptomyces turgidiscabies TaxID=85558 RepID=UPI0038F6E741
MTTNNVHPLPAIKPGHRLVPALIGRSTDPGTIVYIECPTWCTVDHVASSSVFLEDINHEGEHRGMSLSPSHGERVPLEVYLSQWPASTEEKGQTYLAVDLDYEVSSYGRPAALALADQLVAFAADVRRLAQTLPDDNQADEALRRVRGGAA